MGDVLLQIVWVAAHHWLRCQGAMRHPGLDVWWKHVHDITAALGNPPAPGGPR